VDPTTGNGGGMDPTTGNDDALYQARWPFLFRKIINRGGLINSTASVNSINRDGCLMLTAMVMATINCDLSSKAVAKTV
jgi:hypothetical protein